MMSGEAETCFEAIGGWAIFLPCHPALPIEGGATSMNPNASSMGPTIEDITGQE